MPTLTVELRDEIKALAEARAAATGCGDVGEYLARLVLDDACGVPLGVSIGSDEELEALLLSRVDGPGVLADAADFRRMREKFEAKLGPAVDGGGN